MGLCGDVWDSVVARISARSNWSSTCLWLVGALVGVEIVVLFFAVYLLCCGIGTSTLARSWLGMLLLWASTS